MISMKSMIFITYGRNMAMIPEGKFFFGAVKVGEKGQIVIPKEARKTFGINPGDTLVVLGDIKQGIGIAKITDYDKFVEALMGGEDVKND